MNYKKIICGVLLGCLINISYADEARRSDLVMKNLTVSQMDEIVDRFGGLDELKNRTVEMQKSLKLLYPNTKFKRISATSIDGVFEVEMGKNTAYVDRSGRYFLFGHMFDMERQVDITGDVKGKKQGKKIDFKKLPLDMAFKSVRGDGSRVVAVFSDPDCPYCKRLERNLAKLDNVTIYTFMYPLVSLHPDAIIKASKVWCSSDRSKSWSELMLNGVIPGNDGNCANPLEKIISFAEKKNILGTPYLIKSDGSVMPGAGSVDKLDKWLGKGEE